jgi:hypothetical protein
MDDTPVRFVQDYNLDKEVLKQIVKNPWCSTNFCRMISQILVGWEALHMMFCVDALVSKKLEAIPLSLHHDGLLLICKTSDVSAINEAIQEAVIERSKEINFLPMKISPADWFLEEQE